MNKKSLYLGAGVVLFAIGLILLFTHIYVVFNNYSWWGFNLPIGTLMIPLIIGIILIAAKPKLFVGWTIAGLSVIAILVEVIAGIQIRMYRVSLLEYIVFIALLGSGLGLALKGLLSGRKDNSLR